MAKKSKDKETAFLATARRCRPQTFDDVVAQENVTLTLQNAIRKERMAHAYLFSGPRGVGKTSVARILAKAFNCQSGPTPDPCNKCVICEAITAGRSMDVIEIDAASHTGVDNIRDLRETVRFAPAESRFKVYIVDEVHRLSAQAFDALLKTLEEPPSHVKFILATTEEHKVPLTILDRCQRYRFRPISIDAIVSSLTKILAEDPDSPVSKDEQESILFYIAKSANGSLRDAQSLLDQLYAYADGIITLEEVREVLGVVEVEIIHECIASLITGKVGQGLDILAKLLSEGKDVGVLIGEFQEYIRDSLIMIYSSKPGDLVHLPPDNFKILENSVKGWSPSVLLPMLELFFEAERRLRITKDSRLAVELAFIKSAKISESVDLANLLERLKKVEIGLAQGGITPSAKPVSTLPEPENKPQAVEVELNSSESNPPPQNPEPPEKKTSESITLEAIKKCWPAVLEGLEKNQRSVSTTLSHCNLMALRENELTLGIPSTYKYCLKNLEKATVIDAIRTEFAKHIKGSIQIKYYEMDEPVKSPEKEEPPVPTEEQSISSDLEAIRKDEPVVDRILDLFDGKVEEIKDSPQANRKRDEV